jgi:hypothetical protein
MVSFVCIHFADFPVHVLYSFFIAFFSCAFTGIVYIFFNIKSFHVLQVLFKSVDYSEYLYLYRFFMVYHHCDLNTSLLKSYENTSMFVVDK